MFDDFTQGTKTLALLIPPNRPDSTVYARDPKAGFTLAEIKLHLGAHVHAFRLQNGGLLLVDSLFCGVRSEAVNITATCLLRIAADALGMDVCGPALLLGPDESGLLSEPVRSALLLDSAQAIPTLLLFDNHDDVRSIIARGLENYRCRVIQARTPAYALIFCRTHPVDVLIVDIGSLEPHAFETMKQLREAQPQAAVLLTSGYDRSRIEHWYPRLIDGVQFLHKPFNLAVLVASLRLAPRTTLGPNQIEIVACENHDSS
ncbi:MAG TPA: response regulator [Candidatus Angelobacter sp.]|nr:response regulator [Candidatus Angelobacter sp.]